MAALIGARTVPCHREQFQRSPVTRPSEMGHWLTHLCLFVRVFHNIGLIDDIHQGTQLHDAPKYPIYAQTQFPFVVAGITLHQ